MQKEIEQAAQRAEDEPGEEAATAAGEDEGGDGRYEGEQDQQDATEEYGGMQRAI